MADLVKRQRKQKVSLLGQRLAQLRQQSGYSMQKLARETGISAAYICRIESGERKPSRDLLETLADFLIPNTNQSDKDELLIAGGFAPTNFRNFMGRQDVLAIYQKALAQNPDDFKTFIAFVLSLIRAGQYETANEHINQGIQRFDDMVQLQALMAALELSKQNFSQAIQFQQEAIRHFHLAPDKHRLNLGLTDLLLSLGVMYFERGHMFTYQRDRQLAAKNAAAAAEAEAEAMNCLASARQYFEEALEVDAKDVYILDELARVHFTLGYIQASSQSDTHWQASITAFERVLAAPEKQTLGYHALLQSTAFLALAYAKSRQFDKSWFTLNIVEACLPNFWLVHYVKACHLGLMIKSDADPKLLRGLEAEDSSALYELCLKTLQKAVEIDDPQNMTLQEAPLEPDLEAVRKRFNKRFQALLQSPKEPKA